MYLPHGKELPPSFIKKVTENVSIGSDSNQQLDNEILRDCKRLYYQLKKYEPCRYLLVVQQELTLIYLHQAGRDVNF